MYIYIYMSMCIVAVVGSIRVMVPLVAATLTCFTQDIEPQHWRGQGSPVVGIQGVMDKKHSVGLNGQRG